MFMANALKSSETLHLVTFKLGKQEYALDILNVQEVNRMVNITIMPNANDGFEGVINLRGKVIPIISLRKKFGLVSNDSDEKARIMVIDAGRTMGMIVDSVSEVLRLPSDTVEPPPSMVRGGSIEYVKGVGKLDNRLVMLLDVDKLMDVQAG
jgi:purine-binding chemotaxis protein CheW